MRLLGKKFKLKRFLEEEFLNLNQNETYTEFENCNSKLLFIFTEYDFDLIEHQQRLRSLTEEALQTLLKNHEWLNLITKIK